MNSTKLINHLALGHCMHPIFVIKMKQISLLSTFYCSEHLLPNPFALVMLMSL